MWNRIWTRPQGRKTAVSYSVHVEDGRKFQSSPDKWTKSGAGGLVRTFSLQEIITNIVESSKLFRIGDQSQSLKSRNSHSSKQGNLTQESELRELFQPRSQFFFETVIILGHKLWPIIHGQYFIHVKDTVWLIKWRMLLTTFKKSPTVTMVYPLKWCRMGIWVRSILSWTRKCILWWALSWWRPDFGLHNQLWK